MGKKQFIPGTLISVVILSGNIRRAVKYIRMKRKRKVWNKEIFKRLHNIDGS